MVSSVKLFEEAGNMVTNLGVVSNPCTNIIF